MRELQLLLGATTDGNLVFADISLNKAGRKPGLFTVSFDEVSPIAVSDEYLEERASNLLEELDGEYKWDLLEEYDCKPSELLGEFLHNTLQSDGVEGLIDISLYPNDFRIVGVEDDIFFESMGCGQHDTRKELIPIDAEFSEWLHSLWDTYHLTCFTEEEVANVSKIINDYDTKVNEFEWIEKWLTENFNK